MSKNGWPELPLEIILYDGQRFSPADPNPKAITLENLSVAMSRMPRWGGHSRYFYSLAEHSLLVALNVPAELELAALLHDAHEVLSGFGDVPVPVKQRFPDLPKIERRIDEAVAEAFGLDVNLFYEEDLKLADKRALVTEVRDILGHDIPAIKDLGIKPFKDRIITAPRDVSQLLFERRLKRVLDQ